MGLKTRTIALGTMVALAAGMAAGPMTGAASAAKKLPIRVGVGADRNQPPADPETGKRPDPYILFELKNATPGKLYRMVVEDSPHSTAANPCNPGLTTQWYKAFTNGDVAFPLEPVGTGTYFPFAGQQPCRGNYVMNVHERKAKQRSWKTVHSIAFSYPSFNVSDV